MEIFKENRTNSRQRETEARHLSDVSTCIYLIDSNFQPIGIDLPSCYDNTEF